MKAKSRSKASNGKGSCSSKIGIVDEAINNSMELCHTQQSRQTTNNMGANPYNSQASSESLVKVLKSSKADSSQKALISPPSGIQQLKPANNKLNAANGGALRNSKAFHKIAASISQPNFNGLKNVKSGKMNGHITRGNSQDSNRKEKSPK